MDNIVVTLIGVLLIGFIWWFFFGKSSSAEATVGQGTIDITVEGGYKPAIFEIPMGVKTVLNFTRTEDNSCLEEVVIPDFKVKEYLPKDKKVSIKIFPDKKGEFDIHCGMNMYHGRIIVK